MALLCWYLIILAFNLALCSSNSHAFGTFELQVLSIENYRGELADGSCCGGFRSVNGTCEVECKTAFHLCLKEYQSEVKTTGTCTFGNETTEVIAGNSFSVQSHPNKEVIMKLPFTFRWTVSSMFFLFLFSCQS